MAMAKPILLLVGMVIVRTKGEAILFMVQRL
jgi:hypothetical protein